jgi:UDP-glucuronate 4-epimerase
VCERLLGLGHAVWTFDDLNGFYDVAIKRRNLEALASLEKSFTFVQGDLTDAAAVNALLAQTKFEQIIHLAARAGVRPSLADPALYTRVNVEGTVNLLEAARSAGVRKITIASSSSVYGVNAKVPFSEEDPIFSAISPYAASKLACEALGHVYHHVYGMDVAMLRFFTVYGPRQRPDLAIHKFAQLISRGKPIPVFGDGSTARDYTYVTDTVDGVIACTKQEFGYEIFNLGESQTVTLTYLIELLEGALGKKAVIDRQAPQAGDVPITCANIDKARARLGYQPRVQIEQGILKFIEWFRQEHRS